MYLLASTRGEGGFVLGGNGVSCPRPLAYKKKETRFTVIKGQIKAHNGDIDFFCVKKIHILGGGKPFQHPERERERGGERERERERDMISLFW